MIAVQDEWSCGRCKANAMEGEEREKKSHECTDEIARIPRPVGLSGTVRGGGTGNANGVGEERRLIGCMPKWKFNGSHFGEGPALAIHSENVKVGEGGLPTDAGMQGPERPTGC